MGVSAIIYLRGGFSIAAKDESQAFCGTTAEEAVIANNRGKELFSANCASCHSVSKELTGPALAGFEKRLPVTQLYLFIQHSKKAYRKSKYLARLKKEYDIEHFSFPSLTKADIDDIRQYINAASLPIP